MILIDATPACSDISCYFLPLFLLLFAAVAAATESCTSENAILSIGRSVNNWVNGFAVQSLRQTQGKRP